MIYTVKGFSIVNKVEVDVFLEFFSFFYDPTMLAIWSLVPLLFPNPACSSESSRFTYCWSLSWRILRISLLACEMSSVVWYFEHSLASLFFGIQMKTDFFQSFGYCWVFQICWHTECSILTASSFRVCNSWAEIPSPLLALFVVMLPKTHLTSCSRWVTIW